MDSSGSLKDHYGQEKKFLKALASKYSVSKTGVRASVVTFSDDAELSIKFNDHYDTRSFTDAVEGIALMGGHTRIDKALRLTQKEMFAQRNGGRIAVPKVVVMLTDGTQTWDASAEDPVLIADELRKLGMNILVVGVGNRINNKELKSIAGQDQRFFTAVNFDELVSGEFIDKISSTTCECGKFGFDNSYNAA